jgi:hypothetical protein
MYMSANEIKEEKKLLNALEQRNIKAFMRLYKDYGEDLLIFAYSHLQDPKLAIRTVDQFFENLWSDATFTDIDPPIHKFLLKQMTKICEQRTTH